MTEPESERKFKALTNEEMDNLPFNPGWWGKQLEVRDQITISDVH